MLHRIYLEIKIYKVTKYKIDNPPKWKVLNERALVNNNPIEIEINVKKIEDKGFISFFSINLISKNLKI